MAITCRFWFTFSLSQLPCCQWERISGICCTMAHRNYYFHPVRPPTAPSGQWGCVTAKSQTRTASGLREKQPSIGCLIAETACLLLLTLVGMRLFTVRGVEGDSLSFGKKLNHDQPTNIYLPGNQLSEYFLFPPTPLGPVSRLSLGRSLLGLGTSSWPCSKPACHYHLKRIQLLAVGLMDRSWQT